MSRRQNAASIFINLLPFLLMPTSYRRFHFDFWLPYPDVSRGPRSSADSAPRVERMPARPVASPPASAPETRPYFHWLGIDAGLMRHREPFW